jgi:hypothetical protein
MGFLANAAAVWITFVIAVILIIVTLWLLFNRNADITTRVGAMFTGIFVVVFVFLWWYSATHRVVPPNQRWLIVNTATGTVQGEIRQSGLITKPFWLYKIMNYPGASEQPFCLDFYPGLQEGYEVLAHICGTYDAANLDWAQQYRLHNFTGEKAMIDFWSNQAKDPVRSVFHNITYVQINTDPVTVSTSVGQKFSEWLTTQGVTSKNVTLSNWNLTSKLVQDQVDQASAASFQKTVEQQKLEAAKVSRERQLYEIETANQVLSARGKELETLFMSLGITDDAAKAQIISTMTWYGFAQNPPSGVQVIIGADAIAVPGQQSTPAPSQNTTKP